MPQPEVDPRLLSKYKDIPDQPSLIASVSEILEEAHRDGRTEPDAAYAYLQANSASISKRQSPFDASALSYWSALDLARTHLYWQAVCAQVDPSRLRAFYDEFHAFALVQGGDTVDGALRWMGSDLPRLLRENVSQHRDWVIRNRAWGFVQKYMQFERSFGPQKPPDWDLMAAPKEPPFSVLST